MAEKKIPCVKLADGSTMPQIGFGVFGLKDYALCRRCVSDAIRCGYRLFDTATAYFNERAVGDAISEAIRSGIAGREEFFITTKVWLQDFGPDETKASVDHSLQELQTDYLDLVLIHQPYGNITGAWKALEELQRAGIVRSIGTSNFIEEKMISFLNQIEVKPAVDQIEIHPFYTQKAYSDWLRENEIQPEAWGPLNEGQRGIFRNNILTDIGKSHGKSAAQTALRWNLQRGNVIIPKSTKLEHMKENLDILDFELSPQEMEKIESMDLGHSEIVDFHSPATERLLKKLKIHD